MANNKDDDKKPSFNELHKLKRLRIEGEFIRTGCNLIVVVFQIIIILRLFGVI